MYWLCGELYGRPYVGCVESCVRDHILVAWRVVWETIIAKVLSARSPRRGGDHHRLRARVHRCAPVIIGATAFTERIRAGRAILLPRPRSRAPSFLCLRALSALIYLESCMGSCMRDCVRRPFPFLRPIQAPRSASTPSRRTTRWASASA